jgi:tRNA U34 2-thiouridine synthase MnmA/TrmU
MCPQFTEAGRAEVVLGDKDSGLAAGQFAAFYKGDECLGAGSISDSTFLPDQV